MVCGRCHEAFYFIEEFQSHKTDGCTEKSTVQEQCENESFSQVWGFTLWKNKQIHDKSTKNDNKTTSSWEMYQDWCNLDQTVKIPWILAGKSIQFCTNIGASKINEVNVKTEKDPLAIIDTNKAFRTIKEQEKQEYAVEKIVAKRFNPRKKHSNIK